MANLLFGFVLGVGGTLWVILSIFRVSEKLPYSWTCDEEACAFQASSSSADTLMIVIDTHKESHNV